MTLVRSRRAYSLQITDAATSSELTCALCASHLGEPNHPKVQHSDDTGEAFGVIGGNRAGHRRPASPRLF